METALCSSVFELRPRFPLVRFLTVAAKATSPPSHAGTHYFGEKLVKRIDIDLSVPF